MKDLRRRDFLKYAGMGVATLVVGCGGGGGGGGAAPPGGGPVVDPPPVVNPPAPGPIVDTLNFTITDVMKEMVTHEPGNPAECYFWVFKEERFPADAPGIQIFAFEGDRIGLNVTNALDGPHAFFIPGLRPQDPPLVDTGPIAPGETVSLTFEAKDPGTYLYHDNLNAPVNRVMGLHGAFVVMPAQAASGHRPTPYNNPGNAVQQLFDDFGNTPWFPGLAWDQGDANPASFVAPFRQYIWLCHQASPVLFAEVGQWAIDHPGENFNATTFVNAFIGDAFKNTSNDLRTGTNAAFPVKEDAFNRKPHFFTINGQSGHFSHNNAAITPMHRVGEPTLIRILNAGLMAHSMHMHANHFFVTAVNNVPQDNPLWLDVFSLHPMDHIDYTIPFIRPPDIPNVRGIGRADQGLVSATGSPTWPPVQEFEQHFPAIGTLALSFDGTRQIDLAQRQSPLCYPMHDHSEPSQTAQGGNYNCGLISGIYFLGDRNGMMNFPIDADFQMMLDMGRFIGVTGSPAPWNMNHS